MGAMGLLRISPKHKKISTPKLKAKVKEILTFKYKNIKKDYPDIPENLFKKTLQFKYRDIGKKK